jgi:hypothetical protein
MNACDNTLYVTDTLCQEEMFSACLYPPPSNVQVVFGYSGRHEMTCATSTPLREVEGISTAQSVIYVALPTSAVPQPPVQDTPFLTSPSLQSPQQISLRYINQSQLISYKILEISRLSVHTAKTITAKTTPNFCSVHYLPDELVSSNFERPRRNALQSIVFVLHDDCHGPGLLQRYQVQHHQEV